MSHAQKFYVKTASHEIAICFCWMVRIRTWLIIERKLKSFDYIKILDMYN